MRRNYGLGISTRPFCLRQLVTLLGEALDTQPCALGTHQQTLQAPFLLLIYWPVFV